MEKTISSLLSESKRIGYGVYMHWPYCSKICSYCNFNKYRQPIDNNDLQLHKSMETQLRHLLHRAQYPRVTSVYFGGGTPSLAPSTIIASIIDSIRMQVGLVDGAEVTLEVNPSIDVLGKLDSLKKAGVNRVSIGVQSLNDNTLTNVLYRNHTALDARAAIAKASDLFKGSINVDLMFGLPNQTKTEFLNNVREIVSCFPQVNHVSLYQLTLEKGTEMFKHVKNGKWVLPLEDSVVDCYQDVIKLLERYGFVQYEISNFARINYESNHNRNYWLGGNYIGIGPGAHSRYLNPVHETEWIKCISMLSPRQWMKDLDNGGSGLILDETISSQERFEEIFCSSLRTNCGFKRVICKRLGFVFEDIVELFHSNSRLDHLVCDGYISIVNCDSIKATGKGMIVLDSILATILAEFATQSFRDI